MTAPRLPFNRTLHAALSSRPCPPLQVNITIVISGAAKIAEERMGLCALPGIILSPHPIICPPLCSTLLFPVICADQLLHIGETRCIARDISNFTLHRNILPHCYLAHVDSARNSIERISGVRPGVLRLSAYSDPELSRHQVPTNS